MGGWGAVAGGVLGLAGAVMNDSSDDNARDAMNAASDAGVASNERMFNRAMDETQWIRQMAQPLADTYLSAVLGQVYNNPYGGYLNPATGTGMGNEDTSIDIKHANQAAQVARQTTPPSSIDEWNRQNNITQGEGSGLAQIQPIYALQQAVGYDPNQAAQDAYDNSLKQAGVVPANAAGMPPSDLGQQLGNTITGQPTVPVQDGNLIQYQNLYQPQVDPNSALVQNLNATDPVSQAILNRMVNLNPSLTVTGQEIASDPTYQYQSQVQQNALDATLSRMGMLKSSGALTKESDLYRGLIADTVQRLQAQKQAEFGNNLNMLGTAFGESTSLNDTAWNRALQQITIPREWNNQVETQYYSKLLDAIKLSAGAGQNAGSWAVGTGSNVGNIYSGLIQGNASTFGNGSNAGSAMSGMGGMLMNWGLNNMGSSN